MMTPGQTTLAHYPLPAGAIFAECLLLDTDAQFPVARRSATK